MTNRPVYQQIASALEARDNCKRLGNVEWLAKHEARAFELTQQFLPSGSGFDNGTSLNYDASNGNKLVFVVSFHHMNGESGMYDGWTEHTVIVKADLAHGFDLRVTGRDRNDIKDYIGEIFHNALAMVPPVATGEGEV